MHGRRHESRTYRLVACLDAKRAVAKLARSELTYNEQLIRVIANVGTALSFREQQLQRSFMLTCTPTP